MLDTIQLVLQPCNLPLEMFHLTSFDFFFFLLCILDFQTTSAGSQWVRREH